MLSLSQLVKTCGDVVYVFYSDSYHTSGEGKNVEHYMSEVSASSYGIILGAHIQRSIHIYCSIVNSALGKIAYNYAMISIKTKGRGQE